MLSNFELVIENENSYIDENKEKNYKLDDDDNDDDDDGWNKKTDQILLINLPLLLTTSC